MKKSFLFVGLAVLLMSLTSCQTNNSTPDSSADDKMDKTVSIENFQKDGDSFSRKIDNNVETFSFINKVTVPDNFSWYLYSDFEGKEEINTKTIRCEIGNNKVYLLVKNDMETIGFYDVNVYRYDMFTVTFNTNGGTYIEPQQVQEESLISPVSDPEKRGYTFTSWDYDFKTPVISNLRVNALWSANTYHVTFDPNGGSVSQSSMDVTYGARFTFPTPTFTGHTFLGWYEGSTKYTDGTWSYVKDLSLVASWEISTYTIFYHLNGGTLDGSTQQSVSYGSNFNLRIPTRKGYEFLGWFDSSDNEVTSGVWTRESNLDLYAHWNANTYTITLDVNGGTPLVSDTMQIKYDSTYSLPIPSREGYTFAGWFDSNNVKYENEGVWTSSTNLTLFANWSVISYSIKPSIPSTVCGDVGYDSQDNPPSFTNSTYSITYHLDKNTTETISYKVNDTYNLKRTYIPDSSSNHFFVGWYLDENLTTPFNLAIGVKNKENHLYAKWGESTSYYSATSQFQNADNETRRITMASLSAQYCVVVQATGRYKITINPKFEYSSSSKMATIFMRNRGISSDIVFMWDFANTTQAKTYTGQFTCGDTLQFTYAYTGVSVRDYELTVEALDEIDINRNSECLSMSVSYNQYFNFGLPLNKQGKEFSGWYSGKSGSGIKLTDNTGRGLAKWTYTNIDTVYPYFIGSSEEETTISKHVSPYVKVYNQNDKIFDVRTNFDTDVQLPFEKSYTSGSYAYAFKGFTKDNGGSLNYEALNNLSNGAELYPQYEKIDVSSSWKRSVINFDSQTSVSRTGIWNYYYYCPFDGEVTIKWEFTEKTDNVYYQVGVYYATNSGSMYYDRVGEKKLNVTAGNFYYISLNVYSKPSASASQTDVSYQCKLTVESPNGNYYRLNIPTEIETQELFVGENFDLGIPSAPPNYSFAGWYSEPGGKGTKITDNLGIGLGIWNYAYTSVYSYFKKVS